MTEQDDVRALAVAIARYGTVLPGDRFLEEPLDDARWELLLRSIVQEKIIGLAAHATAEGALPLTDEQAKGLASARRASAMHVLMLESTLLSLAQGLSARGIDFRVLKGAALAHTAYPFPGMRVYADVDLLVHPMNFDRAVAMLQGRGGLRANPEPRPGFVGRFGKSAELRLPTGISVDLHRTIAPGPMGLRVHVDDIFERRTDFLLGGQVLPALGREHRFLHACYHAVLGVEKPGLSPLRDVVQTSLPEDLDWALVRATAERWGAAPVVQEAVRAAGAVLGFSPPSPISTWVRDYRPDAASLRLLRLYLGHDETFERRAFFEHLRAIPEARERVSYVRSLLFPTRDYLASRDATYVRHLLRGLRLLWSDERVART